MGEVCQIETGRGRTPVPAEVVGFRAGRTLLMPLGDPTGLGPGATVTASGHPFRVGVSDALLGRSLDGLGRPIDGLGPVATGRTRTRAAQAAPPDPLERPRITSASRSACARSTPWSRAAAASASASSPARASASPRCWA